MNALPRIALAISLIHMISASALAAEEEEPAAHPKWKEGRIRLELSGFAGTDSASEPRSGDFSLMGSIEFQGPITKRITIGPRLIPRMKHDDFARQFVSTVDVEFHFSTI